ncbi:glycosyltransferase family 9 protein [Acidiphilium acidophilum]|nr:lipopolysaccharide heptosyltransferase [Acidiphilium acidophilum DSM 700]
MKVMVIRHGALGDIVLSMPAFAAIRAHHGGAAISLLTTAPFAGFLAQAPWFDTVIIDEKPAPWDFAGLVLLRRRLAGFDMVYDLQTSSRSSRYFRLAGRPEWSGIARGARFFHGNPGRNRLHTRERIAEQLAIAGIAPLPAPDLSWLRRVPPPRALPEAFAALIPGAAPHRPEKRWPAARFGALAAQLPMPAVIFGTEAERPLADEIRRVAPGVIDMTGRTDIAQLAACLDRATIVIGNDTGPVHLAAALGVRCIVLFGGASDPVLTAPRMPDGAWPTIIRVSDLSELAVSPVAAAVGKV